MHDAFPWTAVKNLNRLTQQQCSPQGCQKWTVWSIVYQNHQRDFEVVSGEHLRRWPHRWVHRWCTAAAAAAVGCGRNPAQRIHPPTRWCGASRRSTQGNPVDNHGHAQSMTCGMTRHTNRQSATVHQCRRAILCLAFFRWVTSSPFATLEQHGRAAAIGMVIPGPATATGAAPQGQPFGSERMFTSAVPLLPAGPIAITAAGSIPSAEPVPEAMLCSGSSPTADGWPDPITVPREPAPVGGYICEGTAYKIMSYGQQRRGCIASSGMPDGGWHHYRGPQCQALPCQVDHQNVSTSGGCSEWTQQTSAPQ